MVGGVVNRRRGELNLQAAAVFPDNLVAGGPGLDDDVEFDSARSLPDETGIQESVPDFRRAKKDSLSSMAPVSWVSEKVSNRR